MKPNHRIVGVHITDRLEKAGGVQDLFTEYGCNIKTRLGLHEVSEDHCSPAGLIILELFGDQSVCDELVAKLGRITGVEVKEMIFEHYS